jgi:hypothetical protein
VFPDEAEFLAAGVDERFAAGGSEQVPERGEVFDLQRIDNRQVPVCCELDQAEVGQKAVFRDEFGIEGDDRRRRNRLAEVAKVLVGCDVVVMHGVLLARTNARQ